MILLVYNVIGWIENGIKNIKEGDKVYFVSSSVFVKEATVIRSGGGFVTIKFATNNGNDGPSGIRVRESKVYRTEEEANEVVQNE